jgi:iron complex outermembrane receptor protein
MVRVRAWCLGCSALVSIGCHDARAQQPIELPQITVHAPSPIQRRAPATAAPTIAEVPLPGALPIVTDQFATVTVVPAEELRRSPGATLGDLLFSKPGITGSSFAPGASSRPIVRGLDVNRVGIVANGVPGGGVSDLGEDHAVPIDPLTTDRIEVIRGPATLRYGSQAIGGVVSTEDNRIPTFIPSRPFAFELRGATASVDRSLDGAVLIDAGKDNFAFHADVFARTAADYRVPRYPYRVAPDPAKLPFATQPGAFNGRQPNSALRSDGQAIGGSYFFTGGFAGLALIQNNNLYRIPGPDGEGHNTRIDAKQTKVIGKGEYRPSATFIDAVRFWWGFTNYKHNEIGLADATDLSTDGVRQTFTNRELEGRVEVQSVPFYLRFAELTTALGIQAGTQRLTASSPDDVGSPLNGLFDPNRNSRVAGYIFNEFKFSPQTKAQLAARIEQVNLSGTTPAAVPDVFPDPSLIGPATSQNLSFTPKSASVGLIQQFPFDLVGSVTAQYVERAPKPAELFSRGAHDATATFDIGNPNLRIEVAKSIELGLRRAAGPFRFEVTGYYTRFDGFIFRRLTGNTCDESSCVDPLSPPLELNQAVYSQRDAIFRGGEFQFQWDVLPMWTGVFGVEGQYDIVRATFTDGSNVPRIPPQRLGGGVYFRSAQWFARVHLLHAFAQNNVATTGETPTDGYDLLRAELSHTQVFKNEPSGIRGLTIGVVGNNLLDADIRNHVSYTKDFVLMPGRSVRLFAKALF